MKLRPTNYGAVARQGETTGTTILRLPFTELVSACAQRFRAAVVRHLVLPTAAPALDDLLEETGLGGEALGIQDFFQDYRAVVPRLELTAKGIETLRLHGQELLREDGQWRDATTDLERVRVEALAEMGRRFAELTRRLLVCGPTVAQQALEKARARLGQFADQLQRRVEMEPRQRKELEQVVGQLAAYGRPRTRLPRLALRWRPDLPASWWLSEGQCNTLQRRLYPCVQRAAQWRHDNEVRKQTLRLVEEVLGRPGVPGVLDRHQAEVYRHRAYVAQLAAVPARGDDVVEPTEPEELVLLRDLDAPLHSQTRVTGGDLCRDVLRKAGYTPEKLAAVLAGRGLSIAGRRYRPAEWPRLPLPTVLHALDRVVLRYLGADKPDAPLNCQRPRTALDHLATITPVCPALEPLLKSVVDAWVQQSRPYAEIHNLHGVDARPHVMLYCYPPHRRLWEKRLQAHVDLVTVAGDAAQADALATGHPFVAVLFQSRLAVPLGALRALPRWRRHGNLLRKEGKPPLHDPEQHAEVRLLPRRPDDHDDACLLFESASAAGLLVPVSGTLVRFTLPRTDVRIRKLLAPDVYEPTWKTDAYFHAQLREPAFVRFLECAAAEVRDLHGTILRLTREHDAQVVAAELVRLGVLETGATPHLLRLAGDRISGAPADLLVRKNPLRGLSRDEFISALFRDDRLYNAVFWRLTDALDRGVVSANSATPFLRWYRAQESATTAG